MRHLHNVSRLFPAAHSLLEWIVVAAAFVIACMAHCVGIPLELIQKLSDPLVVSRIQRNTLIPAKMEESGFDSKLIQRIIRMVDQNEYKLYQTPPILRI